MPTFVTDFAPPPDPSGFELAVDLPLSVVHLTWDTAAIAEVDFGAYRIYRSTDGVAWVTLATITDINDVDYDDFEAPLNVSLTYRMTQSNLDFESNPVEGSVLLDSRQWWVVTPNDPSLTFAIQKVTSASLSSEKVQDFYVAVGRPGRIAVGDVVLSESGQLSFLVMPDNAGMVALLKRLQALMDGYIILKAPDGAIHHVQYGDMSRSFTKIEGLQEITIPFTGVS